MRIAYLDCFSGISGDMFLGALLGAGVPFRLFEETVAALDVGARIEVSRVIRSGISATKLDVLVGGEEELPREVFQEQQRRKGDDANEHAHAHAHSHPNRDFHHEPRDPHGRPLSRICELISGAPISAGAKERAIAIFRALGNVEAKIHQVPLDEIHFHEVGAADAIVDIVCAAVGAEMLEVDEWVCSPLNVGGGSVECSHGTFPIPAPATLELLRQRHAPVYSSGVSKELVTPTGAAIVTVLASRFGAFPEMTLETTGYGAGYRDLPGQPNVLRIAIGRAESDDRAASSSTTSAGLLIETVAILEANLDDLSPQIFGYLIDRALAAGALDVFTTPVQMKKSRPGLLLTVLCHPRDRDALARLIFAETTTIGIRMRYEQRYCLQRRHFTVATPWGEVRLKLASLDGAVTNYAPEYEDCRRIAQAQRIPLKTVIHEVVRLYLERLKTS